MTTTTNRSRKANDTARGKRNVTNNEMLSRRVPDIQTVMKRWFN